MPRNQGDQEVGSAGCLWNALERQSLRVLICLRQGESGAWWSRRWLPEGKTQLAESNVDSGMYTKPDSGVQI